MCLRLLCLSSCSVLSSSVCLCLFCKIRFTGSSRSKLDNELVVGGIVILFHNMNNIIFSVYHNIDIFPEIQSKNVLHNHILIPIFGLFSE